MPRLSDVGDVFGPVSGKSRRRFNAATGGTETTVSNYNGTGETWRVHTFSTVGNSTLSITSAPNPFRVLVIGGGGGGGGTNGPGGGGGQGGNRFESASQALTVGSHTVTVGNGGNGGAGAWGDGAGGGQSSLGSLVGSGGQGGAAGNAHGPCDPITNCLRTNISFTSNITGTSTTYSMRGNHWGTGGGGTAADTNGGNGIDPNNFNVAGSGGRGRVIVAYRIA